MPATFRLLGATGGFERRDLLSVRPDFGGHSLDVEFSQRPEAASSKAWVSVVIGKNGVGKSRLLAGIAGLFETLDRRSGYKRRDDISISKLSYQSDDKFCEVEATEHSLRANIDGRRCTLDELPLPSKIIALTTTPFDKFRISRSLLRLPGKEEPEIPERYSYLGLRDKTGRASPTAAIFRALEGLFGASGLEPERRLRIAEVFGFLGYKPHLEVRYELSSLNMKRLDSAFRGDGDLFSTPVSSGALGRILWRDPSLLSEIRQVTDEALSRADGSRSFTLRADFEGNSTDDTFFQRVQILRRAELVRMRAAEVERNRDGAVLDLRLASSGELGIVTGFLGLASVIEDGSLIFVDEPEISLHPEWQSRYIDLLLRIFGNFRGCHFVLATHSPLVLSDISPVNSNVVSLDPDRRGAENGEEFAGQSPDHVLVTAFQEPGRNNLYLKQEVIKALRLAASGKIATSEFEKIMDGVEVVLPKLDRDSPVAKLIRELRAASEITAAVS